MITIGDRSYGVPEVLFEDQADLIIGKYCSIANGVKIFLGGDHRTDWISTFPFSHMALGISSNGGHPKTNGNVVIGNDVWIGTGTVIMSGVTIGDGSVIGAYSVVREDISPYFVAYGNPAIIVRYRVNFSDCEILQEMKWWDWPEYQIFKAAQILMSGDVGKLVTFWKENIIG